MIQKSRSPRRGFRAVPEIVWLPLSSALVIGTAGAAALATGYPLLFPSLAPSAFLQASVPRWRCSGIYCTFVGHMAAIAGAYAVVLALGMAGEPTLFGARSLTSWRVLAAVLAVLLTKVLHLLLNAVHPPAGATALMIALGGFRPEWADLAALSSGVAIVSAAGETVRRLRLSRSSRSGGH